MKQRPTNPLTGLKFGFSGKKCEAGSATFASWIDETAVLAVGRTGRDETFSCGGHVAEDTADIRTPKCHSGRLLRCKLLLLRCRAAASDSENIITSMAERALRAGGPAGAPA